MGNDEIEHSGDVEVVSYQKLVGPSHIFGHPWMPFLGSTGKKSKKCAFS